MGEVTLIIENSGGFVTSLDDGKGSKNELTLTANSVVVMKPEASKFCVKPTEASKQGPLTMLKFWYSGDLRKSQDFDLYIDTDCDAKEANTNELQKRRKLPDDEL